MKFAGKWVDLEIMILNEITWTHRTGATCLVPYAHPRFNVFILLVYLEVPEKARKVGAGSRSDSLKEGNGRTQV